MTKTVLGAIVALGLAGQGALACPAGRPARAPTKPERAYPPASRFSVYPNVVFVPGKSGAASAIETRIGAHSVADGPGRKAAVYPDLVFVPGRADMADKTARHLLGDRAPPEGPSRNAAVYPDIGFRPGQDARDADRLISEIAGH